MSLEDFTVVKPGNFTKGDFEIESPALSQNGVAEEAARLREIKRMTDEINEEVIRSVSEVPTEEEERVLNGIFPHPAPARGSKVTKLPGSASESFPPMEFYRKHRRFPEGLIYINNAGIVMTVRNGEHVRMDKYNAPEIIREFMEDTPDELLKNEAYEYAMKIVI